MTNTIEIAIEQDTIELYKLLKLAGLTGSGGEAKALIADGLVMLNGALETRKRKKIRAGDQIVFADQRIAVLTHGSKADDDPG